LPDGLFSNQKIPVWVNFGVSSNGISWYILLPFGLFYGHWKYFMAIWYILWLFGIPIFPILVFCTKKNLATLVAGSLAALKVTSKRLLTGFGYVSFLVMYLCMTSK
jgi:hypothetical protein